MTKSKTQRIIAILLAVAAVALIVLGFIYMPQRNAQSGRDALDALRIRTLLNATGEGVVEILQDARAVVDLGGIRKSIDVSLVGDVALDEYVVVHVGFAIGRIDPEEAARTLALFAELSESEKEKARAEA